MDKLLTIIIPSYNMEKYLFNCITSLVADDGGRLNGLDVIVVNDGSKDRTAEIGRGFADCHPDIVRVLDKQNGNYGSCINAALRIAAGRFVKVLDADDSFDGVALRHYLTALAGMPDDIDVILSDFVKVDERDNIIGRQSYSFGEGVTLAPADLVAHRCNVEMHALCYRTELLQRIGYRQTEGISYTDTEWCYLPLAASRKMRYIAQPLYRYLLGRVGQTVDGAVFVKNRWMMEKILDRMVGQYEAAEERGGVYDRGVLEYLLCRLAAILATIYAEAVSANEVIPFFMRLHDMSRRHPFFYARLDQFMLFGRTPFRVRYVTLMTRHPVWAPYVVRAYRLYCRLRRLFSGAKKK